MVDRQQRLEKFAERRPLLVLTGFGAAQLSLWSFVAMVSGHFAPGSELGQRPLPLVTALFAANFLLYLASLGIIWNSRATSENGGPLLRIVLLFAFVFRLMLWWSQPIEEDDFYRYLWDGRVLASGINPYHYTPAQVASALEGGTEGGTAGPDLENLAALLRRSPEVHEIFSRVEHRSVPTLYPPLSQAVFALTALATPERASVPTQLRLLKLVLAVFDVTTIALVVGLLRNLGQPAERVLAYAWCPLVLKEFANSGHIDSIAVCLTTAVLWLLTRRCEATANSLPIVRRRFGPSAIDWLASVL